MLLSRERQAVTQTERTVRPCASRARAGAAARAAACATEFDHWCLAQAKDLEIREEVSTYFPLIGIRCAADLVHVLSTLRLLTNVLAKNTREKDHRKHNSANHFIVLAFEASSFEAHRHDSTSGRRSAVRDLRQFALNLNALIDVRYMARSFSFG